jgi:hypothetical protein
LACPGFAAKTLADEGWNYLDSLGFSRPNRDFSMGYAAFTFQWVTRLLAGRIFLAPFSGEEAPKRDLGIWKRRIVHEGELKLVSDFLQVIVVRAVSLSAASIQKQRSLVAKVSRLGPSREQYRESAKRHRLALLTLAATIR